jgi:hypothetical protein
MGVAWSNFGIWKASRIHDVAACASRTTAIARSHCGTVDLSLLGCVVTSNASGEVTDDKKPERRSESEQQDDHADAAARQRARDRAGEDVLPRKSGSPGGTRSS